MINCPDCNAPQWPIRRQDGVYTGGIRKCDQCHASVIIRHGEARIKREVYAEISTRSKHRKATQSEYLHSVINAHDHKILCAHCHAETDLVSGMDGTLGALHGVFCALCLASYPVKTPQDDKRTKRGIRVTPLSWNNPIQRREADDGILAIARAIEAGANPHEYGVMLAGANWTGLRIRELPAEHNQLGAINAEYHNAANRPGRIDTSRGSYFVATSNTWFAANRGEIHAKHCACLECKNRSDRRPRLRAFTPKRETMINGVTLREVSPSISGIGRDVIALVSGILTPNGRRARIPRASRWDDNDSFYESLPNQHKLRAEITETDPPMTLPTMTAQQIAVWRKRRIISIQTAI